MCVVCVRMLGRDIAWLSFKKQKNQKRKKLSRVLKSEEETLNDYFLCVWSSFNTGSESVPLNPPALWCVSKSTHTHTQSQEMSKRRAPHSFHVSVTISNFPLPPCLNDRQTRETLSVTPERVQSRSGCWCSHCREEKKNLTNPVCCTEERRIASPVVGYNTNVIK